MGPYERFDGTLIEGKRPNPTPPSDAREIQYVVQEGDWSAQGDEVVQDGGAA